MKDQVSTYLDVSLAVEFNKNRTLSLKYRASKIKKLELSKLYDKMLS